MRIGSDEGSSLETSSSSSPIISAVESLSCFPFNSLEIRFKRYSIKYEGSVITNDGQRKHNENSLLFRSALVFFSLL